MNHSRCMCLAVVLLLGGCAAQPPEFDPQDGLLYDLLEVSSQALTIDPAFTSLLPANLGIEPVAATAELIDVVKTLRSFAPLAEFVTRHGSGGLRLLKELADYNALVRGQMKALLANGEAVDAFVEVLWQTGIVELVLRIAFAAVGG